MMTTLTTRVTTLEVQLAEHRAQFLEHRGEMKDLLTQLMAKQDALGAQLTKNKGFWGGVVLVITAIWAVVATYGGQITRLFKVGG